MTNKPLPVGLQTFSRLIEQKAVYVDKTRYLYSLINTAVNKYFFSRPRRFGKSLTISTLEAIFRGKKELFNGLWISENTDYDFEEYPVLRFDFSNIAHKNFKNCTWIQNCVRYLNHVTCSFWIFLKNFKNRT